ncbi:MAG: DUF262 domain-containing protein [Spirochaetaceae bacterium]|nr:DUF262 domain-containing protein [Spirochaetaceae bacterium]
MVLHNRAFRPLAQNADDSVASVFGHGSRHARDLALILDRMNPEWKLVYPDTPGPVEQRKCRVSELYGADTLLDSMISDVKDLWPKEPDDEASEEETDSESFEGPSDSTTEISEPFDPTEIKIDTKNVTVDLIMRRIYRNEIDLNPDFQRNSGIWDRIRQSRLIESLLLRIPIPVFYMAADNEDNWQVVDGLQRLDTLKNFLIDKTLSLQGLQYLKDFQGCSYNSLPRPMQRRIDETQLYCHVIQPGTPPEVMFNVFNRINTGGKPLLPQEIRHALNPGRAREFINGLAKDPYFLKATDHGVSAKRMADRECVLRFVAFHCRLEEYKGDLDGFLVSAMKALNDPAAEAKLNTLREDFRAAMQLAFDLFGSDAFRRPRHDSLRRAPINKPLFESWAVNLARIRDPTDRNRLFERREDVKERFAALMDDDEFEQSISIGTQWSTRVNIRFGRIARLVQDVLA